MRCKEGKPVIGQIDLVDERGYWKAAWKKVSPP
jgi:hypothetical protein